MALGGVKEVSGVAGTGPERLQPWPVESLGQDRPTSWLGRAVVGMELEGLGAGQAFWRERRRSVPEVEGGVPCGVGAGWPRKVDGGRLGAPAEDLLALHPKRGTGISVGEPLQVVETYTHPI